MFGDVSGRTIAIWRAEASMRRRPTIFAASFAALILFPFSTYANVGNPPVAHTGYGGELTCEQSGCHTAAPLGVGGGNVKIEVAPYVPGQTQKVKVTITDTGSKGWGFQLTARRLNNPAQPAGTLSTT